MILRASRILGIPLAIVGMVGGGCSRSGSTAGDGGVGTDTRSNVDLPEDTGGDGPSDFASDTDVDRDSVSPWDTNGERGTGSDSQTGSDTDQAKDSDTDSAAPRDTGTDQSVGSDSEGGTWGETDSITGTDDTGTGADSATESDSGADTETDEGIGTETVGNTDTTSETDYESSGDTDTAAEGDSESEVESDSASDDADTDMDTASALKGLSVIADFADRSLEDLEGEGVRSEADISVLLREMESHWEWLSRGLETMRWDITRITLPEPLGPGAYPGWIEYRDAVVTLALENVDLMDYDADNDGDLDAMWIIASNNGVDYPYLIGGASFNAGAHVFVDWQNSESVIQGAVGNFNHELGHLRGLPDLYGEFTTVDNMTLMAYSWAVPPHDLGAWERKQLGWLDPLVISETTAGVVLPSADEVFAAVEVSTSRPHEYFMIENRVTPEDGYGSQSPAFDGLVVYHLLEGSHQEQDPPLLKVEPADGAIVPGSTADVLDLIYPENPNMTLPFVGRSYFGGDEVLRIDNLARVAGGMQFDVVVSPQDISSSNLLTNPSFEEGDGTPSSWTTSAWQGADVVFSRDDTTQRTGEWSASIENTAPNDASFEQTVGGLVLGRAYEACAYLKGEAIAGDGAFTGGNVSVVWTDGGGGLQATHSDGGMGTFDFQPACTTFQAETETAVVECRLGHWSSTVTGKLWCDDLTLEPLGSAF